MGSQHGSGGSWTTPTGSQYSGRITPGSGHRSNKPSPLLTSSRAIASSQARSPLGGVLGALPAAPPDPNLSRQPLHVYPPPGARLLQSGGPSSSATPTHSQIRHVMLSSGSGSQLQTKPAGARHQIQGNPSAYPASSKPSAVLAERPMNMSMGVGPQPLLMPPNSSRSLAMPTAAALQSMETPISMRRGVMLSSVNKPV